MDFDDFDSKDAAILGGIMGFAEENLREENAPDPSEPDAWDFDDIQPEPEPSISLRRRLEMMDPEMRETLLNTVLEHRESWGMRNKSKRLKTALAREIELCKKEERETGDISEESHGRMMNALFDYQNGGVDESDYIKFPVLYFLDEIAGEKATIEIDYAVAGKEKEENLSIQPIAYLKYKDRIYLEALVKPGNVRRYFNIAYISLHQLSKKEQETEPEEKSRARDQEKTDASSGEEIGSNKPNFIPRSEPLVFCDEEFRQAMNLAWDWRPPCIVKNEFVRNFDETITDRATGLMWERRGSGRVNLKQAEAYIDGLNHDRFATCSDWRLPTVDELVTLLKPERQDSGLYIDRLFSSKQTECWSSDRRSDHDEAFCVYFNETGLCILPIATENASYVRAVRRMTETSLEATAQKVSGGASEPGPRDFDRNPDLYFFRSLIEGRYTIKIDYGSDYDGFCHGHVIEPHRLFKLETSMFLSAYSQTEGKKRNYWLTNIMNVRCANGSGDSSELSGTSTFHYAERYSLKRTTVDALTIKALKEPPEKLVKISIQECRNLPPVKRILFDKYTEQGVDATGMFDEKEGVILIDLERCIYHRMWTSVGMLPEASTWFTMLWSLYHEAGHVRQLLHDPSLSEKSLQELEVEANVFALKKVEEWVRNGNSMPKFKDMGIAGMRMKQILNRMFGIYSLGSTMAIEAYERDLVADLHNVKDMMGPKDFSDLEYEKCCQIIDNGDAGFVMGNKRYLNAQDFFSLGFHQKVIEGMARY